METISFANRIKEAKRAYEEEQKTNHVKNITAIYNTLKNIINTCDIGGKILNEISKTGASSCALVDLTMWGYQVKGQDVSSSATWQYNNTDKVTLADDVDSVMVMTDIVNLLKKKLDYTDIEISVYKHNSFKVTLVLDWDIELFK